MTFYEVVGFAWITFTSAIAHIAVIYFAYIGVKQTFLDAKTASLLVKIFGVQ